MYLTEIIANLKNGNLTNKEFDTLIKEFEKSAKQVAEKEEGVLYEFDYYTYTNADQTNGFIKAYRIYDDNTYSISIVDEFYLCNSANSTPEYCYQPRVREIRA